jgi:NAD(P)-dependent dehydrogenase (short-subunit alcohol dehydrogenase family)
MTKIVLITGTSSGFGKVTTELLSEKGYNVYATMRNTTSKNANVATELNNLTNVTVLDLDVTHKESVNNAVAEVISREGKIDVLINNAGYTGVGVSESFTEEDFQNILDVNLMGPWRLMRATLPHFRKQNDGLIINISSGAGRFSVPFVSLYSSTKFALEGLVEGVYFELKQLGIENIILQPGNFFTGLQTKFVTGSDPTVIEGYGEIGQIPNKMAESMTELFESGSAPEPAFVAEKILTLIETEKGKRPLRTVADPMPMGRLIEKANEDVEAQAKLFIETFGLSDLAK